MEARVKTFLTYEEQVARLVERGMDVGDIADAATNLAMVNYYRLSGYWYPFRRLVEGRRLDGFFPGTTLADVIGLYEFDSRLRAATFASLAPLEIAIRALLGHHLGRVDECAHLKPEILNARARQRGYDAWMDAYRLELSRSREDFVAHHREAYGGVLPVWAAVEVLNWGGLTRLFGFSPRGVQDGVAEVFGLNGPQLESWLKSLNIVRNVSAHHGRLFNRVFALTPRLPTTDDNSDLTACAPFTRTFGQLSLIQHMLHAAGVGNRRLLPTVLASYPHVARVPLSHLGADENWPTLNLWAR